MKLPLQFFCSYRANRAAYPHDARAPLDCGYLENSVFSLPRNPKTRRKAPAISTFRMNTCESVSKQSTLSFFRMNTYAKTGGGVIIVN